MLWIAPSEKDTANDALEKRLWGATDQFRANSGLKAQETDETGRLCRRNLAVHGLEGDIRQGGNVNSYYDDPHSTRAYTLTSRRIINQEPITYENLRHP